MPAEAVSVLLNCNHRGFCRRYKRLRQHGERHEKISNCGLFDYSCHWRQWMRRQSAGRKR